MMKTLEITGRTEEAAVQSALDQLSLDRDSVSVEILERPKKGFLGIGSTPAKVRVTYEVPDPAPSPKQQEPEAVASKATPVLQTDTTTAKPIAQEKVSNPVPEASKVEVTTPADLVAESTKAAFQKEESEADLASRIQDFLAGLLEHMGIEATIHVGQKTENSIQVALEGEKLGSLIGHRGETLDAVQQLTNYAVNRGRAHRIRIHIDAEHYRAKREESLRRLAKKVAGKVVKHRRNVTLEPMNAYERHVIHETLQDYPDVITYSTGTEPNRRTVVAFSRGKHSY